MLFEDRVVTPALRSIELGHDGFVVLNANLVDAVFVTVQREESTVARKSHLAQCGQNVIGVQVCKRKGSCIATHETFLRESLLRSVSLSSFFLMRKFFGVTSSNSSSSRNSSDCSRE